MTYGEQDRMGDGNLSMARALGQSEAFLNFQEQLSRVAPIDRPVLILGERGTGKELAAARVHFLSRRWQKPLVTLNCAVLTPTLIGSELFGYEKGAFTGAGSRQTGRFEQADQGTLFLDEIGIIPLEVQEKILRVVEYGSFERVGSSRPVQVDVRIVAATNADLSGMAQSGSFKRDLLDRLSFEVIYVPPLRHRQGDILLLANHFAGRMAFELGWEEVPRISDRVARTLEAYPWPGNIRELKNVIERAVYRSPLPDEGGNHEVVLDQICFDPFESPYGDGPEPAGEAAPPDSKTGDGNGSRENDSFRNQEGSLGIPGEDLLESPLKEAIRSLEHYRVTRALEICQFNQKKAAALLGLTYDQFRGVKRRLGL
ncbi:phage shock protein operon transcriptional activator [Desulfospira joergensenii]|uniref:phage shock protein operon transcriptional activator n=1 Tax=Desulfospira joergensenii TaxID=53329 RepID=UPI0009FBFED4|nr:phage shock protein operon transcriptional activator [Desulfospira joergensenii]